MTYSHTWEPEGVYMKFWEDTSGQEIDEAIDHIRHHPDLSSMKYAIADYLTVNKFLVSKYEALIIAAHDHWIKDANPDLKIALVGSNPETLEAFQLYAESVVIKDTFDVKIFTDLNEARAWVCCP